MRSSFIGSLALALLLSPLTAAAGILVLDGMADPFPPNPCLPVSARAVVFTGPLCDGASCPPGEMVSCPSSSATYQTGLPAVFGGGRAVGIGGSGADVPALGEMDVTAHAFRFMTTDATNSAGFWLDYNGGLDDWNLDFVALGVTGITLDYWGNATPAQPVTCIVDLFEHGTGYAEATLEVGGSSTITLPLASFTGPAGFDWHGIDIIRVAFVNCWRPFGCSDPYPARQYACGPIRLMSSDPTPVLPTTWGRLKAAYR